MTSERLLVYPPEDQKAVIDKTAEHVATHGEVFEKKALQASGNAKLAFLKPDHVFRAYYELRLKYFKEGKKEELNPAVPQELLDEKEKERKKQALKEKKKGGPVKALKNVGEFDATLAEGVTVVEEPAADKYTVDTPVVSPLDIDIIKTTAQFVARNGEKFLINLSQREGRNPQFDFLKPTHALFTFFTQLVDAYSKVIMIESTPDEKQKLQSLIESRSYLMDKCIKRYNWNSKVRKEKEKKDEVEKKERELMAAIDWHDFVIVETLTFTAEDDDIALQEPIDFTKEEIATHLDPEFEPEVAEEGAMEVEQLEVEEEQQPEEQDVQMSEPNQDIVEAAFVFPPEQDPKVVAPTEEEIAVLNDDEQGAKPIIVKTDYVRKVKSKDEQFLTCPLTGQLIPADQMAQHLRTLLLDPKWKLEKDKLMKKAQAEQVYLDDVDKNLADFVTARPDLFGTVEDQIEMAMQAGEELELKAAGADAGSAYTVYNPEAIAMAEKKGFKAPEGPGPAPPPGGLPLSIAKNMVPIPGSKWESVNKIHAAAALEQAKMQGGLGALEPALKRQKLDLESQNPAAVAQQQRELRIGVEERPGELDGAVAAALQSNISVNIEVAQNVGVQARTLSLKIPSFYKVQQLIDQIGKAINVPGNTLKFKLDGGGFLKEDATLSASGVIEGSLLHLMAKR